MNQNYNKLLYLIFFIGITISISYSYFNIKNFDKNEEFNNHLMIRGDLNLIWKEAESFKRDVVANNNLFGNGLEYTRTYLPSKILALYSFITGYSLYEDFEKDKISLNNKFPYLLFQVCFYYLSLFIFFKNLIKFYQNKYLSLFIILFLALDFNIIQWHGTFWTESIFFSLQLVFLSCLLKKNKSYFFFFYFGMFLGVMFYQKTVAIFLIIFLIIFFLFSEKKKKIKKNFIFLMGFSICLLFLGYDNYKKTNIFYIMPLQTKTAHYVYIINQILIEKKIEQINFIEVENKWKLENSGYKNNFELNYNFAKFKQNLALKMMLENKLLTTKIYVKKILAHSLLNPFQTYFWHKYNKLKYKDMEFYLSDESKNYFIVKIIYSLFFYFITLTGIYSIFLKKNKLKFHLLIISMVIYFVFMLGWVGNSRYFMISIIFLSIFFGHGLNFLYDLKKKFIYNQPNKL